MRWPIHIQLLFPMLCVVILGIAAASAVSAYFGGVAAQRRQEENLRRVVDTLTVAAFPLTESVLRQMSGLSGAEFVFLDPAERIEAHTLPLDPAELEPVCHLSDAAPVGRFSSNAVIHLGGQAYLCQRLPVTGPRRPPLGSLVVLYRHDRWWAFLWQSVEPALAVGLAAAAAAVIVTAGLARRFVRPIQKLGAQTAAIVRGDFRPVAVSRRNDELRDLALAINHMAQRLSQYESEVRHNERLRTLGQLGAGIAHQLRNAATGGRMAVELHQRECAAGPECESLQVALRQFRLMESYLQRFLTLGQPTTMTRQSVPLKSVVDEALALLRPACAHAGIELSATACEEALHVCGDAEALHQLVVSLVLNAMDAARRPGSGPAKVAIELDRVGDRAVLEVNDSGPGPAASIHSRLFEPFVSERPDGTGLGLFVTRQIVESHGGTIRWCREDATTCFIAEFPLLETQDCHVAPVDCR